MFSTRITVSTTSKTNLTGPDPTLVLIQDKSKFKWNRATDISLTVGFYASDVVQVILIEGHLAVFLAIIEIRHSDCSLQNVERRKKKEGVNAKPQQLFEIHGKSLESVSRILFEGVIKAGEDINKDNLSRMNDQREGTLAFP